MTIDGALKMRDPVQASESPRFVREWREHATLAGNVAYFSGGRAPTKGVE